MPSYLAKVALLTALYFLAGKFGLSLAVPPGYATIIWPPSGIALGVLLVHGRNLAPGVFLGSFILNATVGHAPHELPTAHELLLAVCIAGGSTLQALLGYEALTRLFGLPLKLRRFADVLSLLLVAAPVTCVVSASVGTASLYSLGDLPSADVWHNWFTWWAGDVFGMLVFLPLTLVMPGGAAALTWRDRTVRGVHAISLTLLVVPLALTFFAWRSMAETEQRQIQSHFEALAKESEQAMITRLAAYASATRSGAGVFQSSEFVSREEWRTFTETLRLREDYPGLLGLGWIEGGVVTYVEPELSNAAAMGRRISAEPRMRAAADRTLADGLPAITQSLRLRGEEEGATQFLVLQAVYRLDQPLETLEQRRGALRGYVYAQFRAQGFVKDLTPSHGRSLDVALFEGRDSSGAPIYNSRVASQKASFRVRRELPVFGDTWTVEWQSTPQFEESEHTRAAYFVLFGGLLFTGLFAVLLVVLGSRRQSLDRGGSLEQPWILPMATFVLVAGGSFAGYTLWSNAEDANLSTHVENETRRIETDLDRSVRMRLQSLRRMAHRWAVAGGTPYVVWRSDARDHVRQIDGLEELQWIGPDYRLHWSEGARRNRWSDNGDIRTSARLSRELSLAAERGTVFMTEPRASGPEQSAFTVYVPLLKEGRFDGFLVGTYSSREFFHGALDALAGSAYAFAVQYDGITYFDNGEVASSQTQWQRKGKFQVNGQPWTFTLSPTQHFVDANRTLLPLIVLLTGSLIALLSAVLVRYVLLARLKAARIQDSARALTESEQRYELALRGMSVGLWDWDVSTNALFWSRKCLDILGLKPGEFRSHYNEFTSRLHPDDRPAVEKALYGHLKRQNPYDLEFRLRRADNSYVWVHAYGQAQFSKDGHAERMAGSIQDITPAREQEDELRRRGAQLRLLIENMPVAVAMLDREMRYIMTSRRWAQDYGFEGKQITGLSHYDVFPEIRSMPQWIDIHRRALRGEKFGLREESWTRTGGEEQWLQWAIYPWSDTSGDVGGIVLFTEDITARKQAEAAQRTTEAMNRAAMDKAPIGKALVSPEGRFLKVNAALCQLLGYSERELLASDFHSLTHADDLEAVLARMRELIEGKSVRYQLEKRYIHRDGRVVWAQLSVSLVRRANGDVDFLVAQIQDITERKLLERIKDEFVSVVSHELRAPLVGIRDSLCEIAGMRDVALPPRLHQLFDDCQRNCERLGALVEGIVDLERFAAGQARFEFRDQPLAEVTREAVRSHEEQARKAGVRLQLADIDPEIVVYVDPDRYLQVISNLLSNAVKFSPSGGVVEVGAELRGDSVRVCVRDQGQGIPEEYRARIFGKFSHGEGGVPRQKSGAGLGLYIARQLVEQMRGHVGFVTQAGAGTTFWVEFPRVLVPGQLTADLC